MSVSLLLSSVVMVICMMVFGSVILCIVRRLLSEKCRLMLNISSIMLIFVSCCVSDRLLMKLGVLGLIMILVSR